MALIFIMFVFIGLAIMFAGTMKEEAPLIFCGTLIIFALLIGFLMGDESCRQKILDGKLQVKTENVQVKTIVEK